jgi:hypothetical protein
MRYQNAPALGTLTITLLIRACYLPYSSGVNATTRYPGTQALIRTLIGQAGDVHLDLQKQVHTGKASKAKTVVFSNHYTHI